MQTASATPNRLGIIIAFAIIYVVWGSTYLGIRYAVETMPPFLMSGARGIIAGLLLYAYMVMRGEKHPSPKQWIPAGIVGLLLLVGGNGVLSWSQKYVASGLASLIVAMVPVYVAVMDCFCPGGAKIDRRTLSGLLLGSVGIALLIQPANLLAGGAVNAWGIAGVLFSSLCWSAGSLYSRHVKSGASPFLHTSMTMIIGGIGLLSLSVLLGETARFQPATVTMRSWLSFAYLVTFGSIIGFTAYVWLLQKVSPARVATYAYVNPVVAVLLGCVFASEKLTMDTFLAAPLILVAVWLITARVQPRPAVSETTIEVTAVDEQPELAATEQRS